MEEISSWLNDDFSSSALALLAEVEMVARAHVIETGILVGLALLSAVIARSFLMFIASLLVTCIALAARANASAGIGPFYAAAGFLALAILVIWTARTRWRLNDQRLRIDQLAAQNVEGRRLLDREIEWRQAGEASRTDTDANVTPSFTAPSTLVEPDR